MTYPITTPEQVQALLARPEMQPVEVEGFKLSATLRRGADIEVAAEVDGKWCFVPHPGYEVIFDGGRWGQHVLRLSVSSPERIAAHWRGYVAAHTQHAERKEALKAVPAGAKFKRPTYWEPKVGDKCFFQRGMFGLWQGTIRRIYVARGFRGGAGIMKGTLIADITCRGANGKFYTYKRVPLRTLSKNGVHPHIEEA